jgi:hypothetical protein
MPFSTRTVRRVGRPSPSKGEVPKPPVLDAAVVVPLSSSVIEDQGAVVDDGDVLAGDALAEHVGEEGGVAIDGVAVGRVEDVADDGAGDLRREDHGGLLGLHSPRAQAA